MDMWEYAKKLKNLRGKYVCPWKIEKLKKTEKCVSIIRFMLITETWPQGNSHISINNDNDDDHSHRLHYRLYKV